MIHGFLWLDVVIRSPLQFFLFSRHHPINVFLFLSMDSSDKIYPTGFVRYPHGTRKDRLWLKEIVSGTEVDVVTATAEVDLLTTIYYNITNSNIAVRGIAQAAFDGPTDSSSYREHLSVVSETLIRHAPSIILDHDAKPLAFARTYRPRTTPVTMDRVGPPIIFNHKLIKIYNRVKSLENAKSLGLHTIIVATFFRELVHYIRYMVGLKLTPELRQGVYNPKDRVREINGEGQVVLKGEGGFYAQTEIFGQLTSYIKEGGATFNDLVALSFTTRDDRKHYFALSAEDVPFLRRFTRVEWAGVREDLEICGSRERSFGPAFPAQSVSGPESVESTGSPTSTTLRMKGPGLVPPGETEAEYLERAASVFGRPVTLLYM
ncbi:hypothetical protein BDZ89DRAFT_688626 [Hymenopellis radicata]|nr:hypothetical protein BDZ89DRAFT_688626 [Hymenopellis radicata]